MSLVGCGRIGVFGDLRRGWVNDSIEADEETSSRGLIVVSNDQQPPTRSRVAWCCRWREKTILIGMLLEKEIVAPHCLCSSRHSAEDFAATCQPRSPSPYGTTYVSRSLASPSSRQSRQHNNLM